MELFRKYEHLQIEDVCRICLTKKDQMNMIYGTGLADMLLECASIQITAENGLFHLVCSNCANEVSRWYIFKQQVIQSFEIGQYLLDRKQKMLSSSNCRNMIQNTVNIIAVTDEGSLNSQSNTAIENVEKLKRILEEDNLNNIKDNTNVAEYFQTDEGINLNATVNDSTRSTLECSYSPVSSVHKQKKTKELICNICKKQCTSTYSYNRHIKTHDDARPYMCSKCDKSFKTSQVLNEHMKRHYDDRRHKCDVCGQKFYAKASLTDHTRSHTGERPFKCETCARTFSTKAVLRQHSIVHTTREKKFQCDICCKFLLTISSLETHKRKHSGIKPFPCSSCDKSFFTKEAMQRHFAAIHDTDNNFLCSVCSKVCSTKVHLNNHMKKKHVSLGTPANALCGECGKQCGSAAELKVHVRVHTGERPFVCDICNKRFIARGNLNSHKQRHTGNKPFLCNQCGKAFGEKSTLKVHERIHTGEHPYKCNVCSKSYVQSSALKTHIKNHHWGNL